MEVVSEQNYQKTLYDSVKTHSLSHGSNVALCSLDAAGQKIELMIYKMGEEEKRIYEEKVAKRNLLIRQQQKERDAKEREARDKAIGGGG